MTNPTESTAWNDLLRLCADFKHEDFHLAQLFEDNDRFSEFSVSHENLLLDYSKNFVTTETIDTLIELAKEMGLTDAINAMFAGEKINITENRAALHSACRIPEEKNSNTEIVSCLKQMDSFVTAIHSGEWKGYSGNKITDIVNIGIGGSDLGPVFVCDALSSFSTNDIKPHFVSNVDPTDLDNVVAGLDPATTLFIVASKSFKTLETIQNAHAAKNWLLSQSASPECIRNHFVAITTNSAAASEFGIQEQNLFPMWEWLGGRYSLWSAIGLPIALSIGMNHFRQLLAGAHSMDKHFHSTELRKNLPVIMGLLTVWYTGFLNAHSHAVVPYSQKLQQFPAYLQQLYMESLGKNVNKNDEPVTSNTGDVLWGAVGTNAQHSFFQLLHQGTEFIPVDFLGVIKPTSEGIDASRRQQYLLANCLSQSLALMQGNNDSSDQHKKIQGNKPSNILLINELNPYNLGSLIALYEHKTYVQSVIWNINAFDQWGVQLGKVLSNDVFKAFTESGSNVEFDSSTASLIKQIGELLND